MSEHKFKIEWFDPTTNEPKDIMVFYEDTEELSAWEWAETYAIVVSDNGWYKITEHL